MGSHKAEFESLHKKQIELFDNQIKLIQTTVAKNRKIAGAIIQ